MLELVRALQARAAAIVQQFPTGDAFRLGISPHRFDDRAILLLVNDLGPIDAPTQVSLLDDDPIDWAMRRLVKLAKAPMVLEREIQQLLSDAVAVLAVPQRARESPYAKFLQLYKV